MPETTVERDLAQRLDALRKDSGDTVRVDQVGEIVRTLMLSVAGEIESAGMKLHREIGALAQYIHEAKAEIAALRPQEIQDRYIASATDELDAVVEATEYATNGILDAAEKIESMLGDVPAELSGRLTEIATQIYESCNFQDITGQRITKVVRTLKEIEQRVDALVGVFGGVLPAAAEPVAAAEPQALTDADLLNGPQLPNKASRQDQIDALLAGSG